MTDSTFYNENAKNRSSRRNPSDRGRGLVGEVTRPDRVCAKGLSGYPGRRGSSPSRVVIGQVVLVQDGIARTQVLPDPVHRLVSGVDQDHLGRASPGTAE